MRLPATRSVRELTGGPPGGRVPPGAGKDLANFQKTTCFDASVNGAHRLGTFPFIANEISIRRLMAGVSKLKDKSQFSVTVHHCGD